MSLNIILLKPAVEYCPNRVEFLGGKVMAVKVGINGLLK
jgi:hypothetical protein